jgi:hypothetical protein
MSLYEAVPGAAVLTSCAVCAFRAGFNTLLDTLYQDLLLLDEVGLLEHFWSTGVMLRACGASACAQDPELYGDGWTPLMAACVGGRVSIAATLLARAGPAAARLVHAANRYGLTAAHIAARRGSQPLLRALLEAGGGSIARVRGGPLHAQSARMHGLRPPHAQPLLACMGWGLRMHNLLASMGHCLLLGISAAEGVKWLEV